MIGWFEKNDSLLELFNKFYTALSLSPGVNLRNQVGDILGVFFSKGDEYEGKE